MEPDVALSVRQLYELLVMPEWQKDQAGDTRGYAFLMLAEGAIHGILRSAETRGAETSEESLARGFAGINRSWHGIYDDRFPIELDVGNWSGSSFNGTMPYPDGNTTTKITGTAEDAKGRVPHLARGGVYPQRQPPRRLRRKLRGDYYGRRYGWCLVPGRPRSRALHYDRI